MKLDTQDYGSVVIVSLDGEFDRDCTGKFQETIDPLISEYDRGIVLDLSNVPFLDSEALESLLALRDKCVTVGAQLKLAGLDENCVKILEVTRLDKSFDCYEELASAVQSYA